MPKLGSINESEREVVASSNPPALPSTDHTRIAATHILPSNFSE
jgi:hypothetical protein